MQYTNIIIGGDFNIDFASRHPLSDVLCGFMADLKLINLDSKLPPGTNFSFRVDASEASSLIVLMLFLHCAQWSTVIANMGPPSLYVHLTSQRLLIVWIIMHF